MSDRARLFKTGGSQAVSLPKKYRFEGLTEVAIRREGDKIVLEPLERSWSKNFLDLAGTVRDFPTPKPIGPPEPGPELD